MEEKKVALYPMEIMGVLIQGFEQMGVDGKEASFGFLSSLLSDVETDLENWEMRLWELVVSAYPITKRNLMGSFFLFTEEVQKHAEFEYRYHLKVGSANDWPFFFTKTLHLGGFHQNEKDTKTLWEEFNNLCRQCVPVWDDMHPAAQKRLEQLLVEVLALNPDNRLLDFSSPIENVVIPPLTQEDIAYWENVANALAEDENKAHLVQSVQEMVQLLRFCKCVKHCHVEGYTDISPDTAQVLLRQCVQLVTTNSPFIISEYFKMVCEAGLATQALGWFRLYRDTLLRPVSYGGISLSKSAIHAYVEMLQAPSRLAVALFKAAINRQDNIIYLFLEDDSTSKAVNNKRFIDDLFALLRNNPNEAKATAKIYYNQRSSHSDYIKGLVDELTKDTREKVSHSTTWGEWSMPEEFIVKEMLCDDWILYYDDKGYLMQAIAQAEVEDCQILQLGYGSFDLELSKQAMRKDTAAFDYLSAEMQKHPDIQKLLKEDAR